MAKELEDLFKRGYKVLDAGDWEKAYSLFEFILGRCEVEKEPMAAAKARRRLGDIETFRGNFNEAGAFYQKALEVLLPSKELDETADCLRGLGYLHWRKADYNMANEYLAQGLERALQSSSKEVQGRILIDMGNVASSLANLEVAERLYNEAITALEGYPNSIDADRALMNLGDVYLRRQDLPKAASIFEKCANQCRERHDGQNLSWALLNIAECKVMLGDLRKVPDLIAEARKIMTVSDDKVGFAATKRVLGQWAAASGNYKVSAQEFDSALLDYQEMDMPERRAVIFRLYGQMLAQKGDKAKAMTMLGTARDLFLELGSPKEHDNTVAMMNELSKEGRK
jgi:tetratricopeptide (TPR) repeat protein